MNPPRSPRLRVKGFSRGDAEDAEDAENYSVFTRSSIRCASSSRVSTKRS